jgi:hypothetical protein
MAVPWKELDDGGVESSDVDAEHVNDGRWQLGIDSGLLGKQQGADAFSVYSKHQKITRSHYAH